MLYLWGNNESLQCGNISQSLINLKPGEILSAEKQTVFINRPFQTVEQEVRVIKVACGKEHTLVLASDKCVYSFGSNKYGQLGLTT